MTPLGGVYDDIVLRQTTPDYVDETPVARPRNMAGLLAGLGAEPTLIDQVKETADTIKSVAPFLEFVGAYPMVTIALLMAAIVGGGALGGYIGAGTRKKNPFDLDEDTDNVQRLQKGLEKLSKKVELLLEQSEDAKA
jgi:hypothetical protein